METLLGLNPGAARTARVVDLAGGRATLPPLPLLQRLCLGGTLHSAEVGCCESVVRAWARALLRRNFRADGFA